MVMAFSTASSNATLPYALKVADENLKLPRAPARFVLTIGATANQNGTAIFEGVTVLFLAQFFGVDLSIGQQVIVLLMCIIYEFFTVKEKILETNLNKREAKEFKAELLFAD